MDGVLRNPQFQIKLSELLDQDWFKIGIYLNIKERMLESIKNDSMNFPKPEQKAYEMIKKWFNFDKNPTFEKLQLAILSIPKNDLLKEVEDLANMFLNDSSHSPSNTSERNSLLNTGSYNQFPLTQIIVGRVGYLIGDKFDSFGRRLGLSQYDVSNINTDERNAQAKAVAVINMWIERNGISKWEQLKKELLLFECKNTVEIIENEFAYK
ncbi:uncharacterized protein LOC105845953 [Hydra vulgaris]|uniref:uncharacterized protein LOC105845953 n=1 Tax=Hydra vulgaris TaxID=6087 RepID=UPI000192634B|nr:uncharacterized protein LOC105845953 isoform X1 [Hydra vulgaris]XP_047131732.1 uncharacterized protein LOC105845953 isoform X1 [Hydra vulgaris]XP_047131733.1 uncharacterized protein LOC105845953 isoform X1 [Hydra vulgaris]